MTENRGGDSWFRRRWSGGETGLTRWQERCDSRWRETTGKPYCLGETSIYRSEFNQLVACKSRKKTEIFKGLSSISKHLLEQTVSFQLWLHNTVCKRPKLTKSVCFGMHSQSSIFAAPKRSPGPQQIQECDKVRGQGRRGLGSTCVHRWSDADV